MSQKNWKIYLIHHSHTDIGYTERQEKIIRYHYDFIRQAMESLDTIHEKKDTGCDGFVWQCENYWQVENFYRMATEEEKAKFEAYVKSGEIGLSGNYLNMTELVTEAVLDDSLEKMEEFGKRLNHPITAGMSADINGLAWGYGDALYKHGVRYFYSALHPHHGMFPLYKKVIPFYWETPKGNRILVWNGEHYHLGNEMFFSPHGGSTYTVYDEFDQPIRDNRILNGEDEDIKATEEHILHTRLERYLRNLENEQYPYDLVPFMVSGAITDNAPPNKEIAHRVNELNAYYNGRIVVQMVTLEEFFRQVEEKCKEIPVYKGDFTDWWADGIGSTPNGVKLYLDAARKYDLCKKLDGDGTLGDPKLLDKAREELMLYAEHTWGYSSSVSEPYDSMVETLELKKTAYGVNANTDISSNLDTILAKKGEVSIRQDKPQRYVVMNPHELAVHTRAYLYIEFWEYIDGKRFDLSMPIVVTDSVTGEIIPSQVKQIARATQVEVELFMEPKEERKLEIHLARVEKEQMTIQNYAHIGAEGVEDVLVEGRVRIDEEVVETDDFRIVTDGSFGVKQWIWKKDGENLIRGDALEGAFAGVYEITEMDHVTPCEIRRSMGRNRKSMATKRYKSHLCDRKLVENGDLFCTLKLSYELEGTRMYDVFLKAYKHMPKAEVTVRIHKTSRWEPENLYISLPFTAGGKNTLYVDKTGCVVRPGIDQLPGSCQDFYLIQNGLVWEGCDKTVSMIAKDAPLISLGGLEAKRIKLCSGADEERNHSMVYSWPMNNFWETNFKVDLGGFYEFRYILDVEEKKTVEQVFDNMRAENQGLLAGYAE